MAFARLLCAGVLVAAVGVGVPTAAIAAPTPSATLDCGVDGTYEVTGFGRGRPLHLTTSQRNFVVVHAENLDTGALLADIPGQSARQDVMTCRVTAPVTGTRLLLKGFLTPRSR